MPDSGHVAGLVTAEVGVVGEVFVDVLLRRFCGLVVLVQDGREFD